MMNLDFTVSEQFTALPNTHFEHATNGVKSEKETKVWLKHSAEGLHVKFACLNDKYVSENYLKENNAPLYNQEVFEIFISPQNEKATEYLEFEINPNDAIWIGKIKNPTGKQHLGDETQMIDPETSGISHKVDLSEDAWSGEFLLPYTLIGGKQSSYLVNFYRIVSTQGQKPQDWSCGTDNAEFLCYQSTLSGSQPAFHRTASFFRISLK